MLSVSECPCQWPRHRHDFLERKRSIANARRKFALVAVHCNALSQRTWDLTKPCNATKNWTSTVSDKRNTASAFAFATATHVSHIAPSQRPQAGRRSPRTRAPPDPRLSSPRFRIDRNRQRRSHANWLSWPHAQPVIDEDDVLGPHSPPCPLYCPLYTCPCTNKTLLTPSFIVSVTSATTCTNVHRVWRAIVVCRFTARSALGATMRCVRPSHWFVLSLTLTCRPLTGQRISPQLRKPRRPWQDHARTPRHHRRHHSD